MSARYVKAAAVIVCAVAAILLLPASRHPATHNSAAPKAAAAKVAANIYLAIDKLHLTAPIVLNVDARDEPAYDQALEHGVAHMLGTSKPNEAGNIVFFGHSSAPKGYKGQYGTIFDRLGDLTIGDQLTIKDQATGQNSAFVVAGKKIVGASDTSLIQQDLGSRLTITTCWPIGDNSSRLIVWAMPRK